MCRKPNKREITLNLLRKAESASSATKANLLRRFGSIQNPVSICRELGTVVKALVRALTDAEPVGDSPSETSTATDGIALPTGEVASPPAGETLITRPEERLQGQSTVSSIQARHVTMFGTAATTSNSAVLAGSGAGAPEGVTASGKIGNTEIQSDGDDGVVGGVDSVDGATHDKRVITAIQDDGGDAVVGCLSSVDKSIHDKTATPGNKGAGVDLATSLDSNPNCGAGLEGSTQVSRRKGLRCDNVRATHVSHKHACPPAPERGVWCGGGGGMPCTSL